MITEISFLESIIVTVFSMVVVFLSLIAIAFIINRIKLLSVKEENNEDIIRETKRDSGGNSIKMSEKYVDIEENYEELVAVLAAAVAIQLGVDIPDINIQSIRRIPNNTPTWRNMGKQNQMLGKLS